MVRSFTFAFMIICFFVSNILLERRFKKNKPKIKLGKVLGLCVVYEFILLTVVVLIPSLFFILIYGSIIMGSFVTVYFRHKPSIVMEG